MDKKWDARDATEKELEIDKFGVQAMLDHIDTFGRNLNSWEVDFISGLIDQPPEEFSEKQKAVIQRIYDRKC